MRFCWSVILRLFDLGRRIQKRRAQIGRITPKLGLCECGALDNSGGTATILDTTLSGNTSHGDGAALSNASGSLTLTESTVSGNSAPGSGNAVIGSAGTLILQDDTVSANSDASALDNEGGKLSLQNSIVAGNTNSSTSGDIAGVITTDAGNNLLGTAANNSTIDPHPGPGDVFSNTPDLSALGNYGGPTQTMALLAGSLAIGTGNAAAANLPSTDQRGQPRLTNGKLDMGAFQTRTPALAFTTLGQTAAAGQQAAVTVALVDGDGKPVAAGAGGVTLTLASNSKSGSFFNAFGNALPGDTLTIAAGTSSVTFEYADTQPGTPAPTVSASGYSSVTQPKPSCLVRSPLLPSRTSWSAAPSRRTPPAAFRTAGKPSLIPSTMSPPIR